MWNIVYASCITDSKVILSTFNTKCLEHGYIQLSEQIMNGFPAVNQKKKKNVLPSTTQGCCFQTSYAPAATTAHLE